MKFISSISYTVNIVLNVSFLLLNSTFAQSGNNLTIHVANQNMLPESGSYLNSSINTVLFDTFVIGGFGLMSGKKETLDSFTSIDPSDLIENFRKYLGIHGKMLHGDFKGSLLLDIEHPVHLSNLSSISKNQVKAYVSAVNKRVSTVRHFFPYAKIGLYGLFVPYQKCGKYKADEKRLTSFLLGVENGILKDVDYFTVISYLRWGPDNIDRNQCIAEKVEYIHEVVDGLKVPYRPMLSLRVYNRKSSSDRKFMSYKNPNDMLFASLISQLKIFQEVGIKDVILYHPSDDIKPDNDMLWSQSEAAIAIDSSLRSGK